MSAAHDNNIKKFSTQSKLSDYSTEWYYTPSSEEKKEKVLKFSKMTGTLSKMIVIEKKRGKTGIPLRDLSRKTGKQNRIYWKWDIFSIWPFSFLLF